MKPTKQGERFFHYQSDIAVLGALKAKQTPSDCGLAWWLFTDCTENDAKLELANLGVCLEGSACHCDHDCCGHIFVRPVFFEQQGRRILARQSWGTNL